MRFGFVILIIANEQLHLDAQPNSSINITFVHGNYNLKDALTELEVGMHPSPAYMRFYCSELQKRMNICKKSVANPLKK